MKTELLKIDLLQNIFYAKIIHTYIPVKLLLCIGAVEPQSFIEQCNLQLHKPSNGCADGIRW